MDNAANRGARPFHATRILALGFLSLILLGAALLSLPLASATGESVGFADALFTSTSAVCVTGLVVLDTGTQFSRFGHVVLMLLIQTGGLGFMALGTLVFLLLGKRITLRERLLIRESMNADRLSGMVRLMRSAMLATLCVEVSGALLLSIRFVPELGWGEGLFRAAFTSVSAFCNAGFDLTGGGASLTPYSDDPLVLGTVMALIVLGGLGFAVLLDLRAKRELRALEVHSRLVLCVTAGLILFGAACTLALEWNNPATLGAMGAGEKVLNAFFQSVTLRTAGFNAVDQNALRPAMKLISCAMMFIGASPASTGGGVKVTTFSVLTLMLVSIARGREEAVVMRHTLPRAMLQRAMAVFLIALGIVLTDAMLLLAVEPDANSLNLIFEAFSAFGTAGLSCGVTGALSPLGRALMIAAMFIGRVGPLTIALAIAKRQAGTRDVLRYPAAKIMIG